MRIGTRGSALALAQAGHVAELLGGGELIPITTSGDSGARQPERGEDKSRWVAELESALLAGEIDVEPFISHRITLDEVNRGFELMEAHDGIRSVIEFA